MLGFWMAMGCGMDVHASPPTVGRWEFSFLDFGPPILLSWLLSGRWLSIVDLRLGQLRICILHINLLPLNILMEFWSVNINQKNKVALT